MDNVKIALTEFGLSQREAAIYLTLRKSGALSVTDIGRLTGIPRASIYSSLEELRRQGIITCLKKNRRHVFEAQAPSVLLNLLRRRFAIFESFLPLLQSIEPKSSEAFMARVYEGADQSRQAQLDLYEGLAKDKVKLVHSISHPDLAKKFPRFLPLMIERRRQMGISTRLLVSASQRRQVPTTFRGKDREIRYLPGRFPFNCTCVVGGTHTLFILTQGEEPNGLLIRSQSVSEMISACLSFIWEQVSDV